MKKHLSISIASILALSTPSIVNAQLYATTDIGGVPTVSGATLENFDEPTPSILTLSGSAYLLQTTFGGIPNVAPPYLSGATAAFFGETPANGYDNSQFVVVQIGGSATLNFSTPQTYLGLLWGSVDAGNALTFYDSANNVIGTVLGSDLSGVPVTGSFLPSGSPYVDITSATPFSRVVATSSRNSFEFDDVAYALVVPEPASLSLLVFGMFGITLLRRRQH
jgi:hypothetical protein